MSDRNREIYEMWRDIQDLIGPARTWPYNVRRYFWTQNLKHFERIVLAVFVWINGLNPEILMEWCHLKGLLRDQAAVHHMEALFRLFRHKNYRLYGYNVTNRRYEYLDGTVRHYIHASERH